MGLGPYSFPRRRSSEALTLLSFSRFQKSSKIPVSKPPLKPASSHKQNMRVIASKARSYFLTRTRKSPLPHHPPPSSGYKHHYCLGEAPPFKLRTSDLHGNAISKPTADFSTFFQSIRVLSSRSSHNSDHESSNYYETIEEVEPIDIWEEEEDAEPMIGDGGDGGGIVLHNCSWGEQALAIANEVLLQFQDDLKLYAFKTSPRGYIYVRLDKISDKLGCPTVEELEDFNQKYKRKLDEAGAAGQIPDDLALEISSPSVERLLRVPEDLERFEDMAMTVRYTEDLDKKTAEKSGVFFLEGVDTELGTCTWRLADVKENRSPAAKGRPLSRKQKDWRLRLPFAMFKKVTLYLQHD